MVSGHTTQSTTTDPAGGRAGLAVVGPAVTAFLAYLATLTRPDLTGDERDLVASARRPFGTVARLFVDGDAATGGYEAFLHAWSRLVGEGSAFWLRLPSAAAMALAVGLTAGLACRWWGSSGAVTAGTFLALSPTAWRHALEVGSASLVVLLAVLSTWLLLSAADREQWTGWVPYLVSLTLLGLVQPAALLVVLAHPLLLAADRSRNLRQWLWSALDGLVVPLGLLIVAWLRRPDDRIPPDARPPDGAVMAGLPDAEAWGDAFAWASGGLPFAALLGVAGLFGVVGARRWSPGLVTWFALPPVLLVATAQLLPMPFEPELLAFCLPALVLLAAGGVRAASGWQVALVCGFAGALAAPTLWRLVG